MNSKVIETNSGSRGEIQGYLCAVGIKELQEGEKVDEFCTPLKAPARNCDLGNKEESRLSNVYASYGPQGPELKEETDGKRPECGESITSGPYRRNK